MTRNKEAADLLRQALSRPFDLREQYRKGQERFQRMWMTIEAFTPFGVLQARIQWRGDLRREVREVNASGQARESVTWRNVGTRNWLVDKSRYAKHQAIPFAEGFSYDFSAEDDYDELTWDYSSIPREPLGRTFRTAFSVTAHLEFDFLRSSRHATIERLRQVGELMTDPPEEGKTFSVDFPPFFTDSRLHRKGVQMGFLGLTLANNEACAIVDFKQGPQDFFWNEQAPSAEKGQEAEKHAVRLKSWQDGALLIRIEDGSLVRGELTEWHMIKRTPASGGNPVANHSRGIWSIREIAAPDFAMGLKDWDTEQTPTPQFRPGVRGS